MGRFYKKISKEHFLLEIDKVFTYYEENGQFNSAIEKDISKVEVDRENISRYEGKPDPKYYPKSGSNFASYLVSYYKMPEEDFHVYFVNVGGDWEFPICFILYWDGSKIRGYIPTEGNIFHKKQKVAFGSHEPDSGKSKYDSLKDNDEEFDDEELNKQIDNTKIVEDISNRIKLKI